MPQETTSTSKKNMRPDKKIFTLLSLPPKGATKRAFFNQKGFTIIELVLVIIILAILAVTASSKWPTGMKNEGAILEFKHAVRFAQHKAMTRRYTSANTAWGITISSNHYTVQRADGSEFAESDFNNRGLPGDATIIPGGPNSIWFNGLGEPIDNSGVLLADSTFTIGGAATVTIFAETGYVE